MLGYIFVIALLVKSNLAVQCKNENGDNVDWFYVYKMPALAEHHNRSVYDGVAYYVMTPDDILSGWRVSEHTIDDPKSLVGRTLAPMYTNQELVSLIYNDQPPETMNQEEIFIELLKQDRNKAHQVNHGQKSKEHLKYGANHRTVRSLNNNRSRIIFGEDDDYDVRDLYDMNFRITQSFYEKGHTKGVVLADTSTAFWLIHSVPHFAPIPDFTTNVSYSYPSTGKKYGQTFLCLSLNTSTLNDVALQLKYNEPLVVYAYMPTKLQPRLPTLLEVMLNRTMINAPWYHTQSIRTIKNKRFLSFAKGARFFDDLYNYVADYFKSDLLVESWINGPGVLDAQCNRTYHVRSIESVQMPNCHMFVSSHHDHSKWAVTEARGIELPEPVNRWICVGDINRAKSQAIRGGGTVCTNDADLWSAFRIIVKTAQLCP